METKTSTTKLLPQQQCTYAAELKKGETKEREEFQEQVVKAFLSQSLITT